MNVISDGYTSKWLPRWKKVLCKSCAKIGFQFYLVSDGQSCVVGRMLVEHIPVYTAWRVGPCVSGAS